MTPDEVTDRLEGAMSPHEVDDRLAGFTEWQIRRIAACAQKEWQNRGQDGAAACQKATDKAVHEAVSDRVFASLERRRKEMRHDRRAGQG